MMQIRQMLTDMSQKSKLYNHDIQDYVCMTQRVFSAFLCLFFAMHSVFAGILNYNYMAQSFTVWISSFTQIALTAVNYLLFKYYFPHHRKRLLLTAYLHIFLVTISLEGQYLVYGDFISYTIITCIILSTSLVVIGHVRAYIVIISGSIAFDVITTILQHPNLFYTYEMYSYVIDSFFIVLFSLVINFSFSRLKYLDFENKRRITFMGERDSLTGLLNRRALETAVKEHGSSGTLCALILLDLDNFKALNDTLGHFKGDDCLCAVAKELTDMFRKTDYIARFGGDEFVVFLPNLMSTDAVTAKAQMLLEKIPRTYHHESGDVRVTCSVGLAFAPANGDEDIYEKLYKAADAAMYASKASGKNAVTIQENAFSN